MVNHGGQHGGDIQPPNVSVVLPVEPPEVYQHNIYYSEATGESADGLGHRAARALLDDALDRGDEQRAVPGWSTAAKSAAL